MNSWIGIIDQMLLSGVRFERAWEERDFVQKKFTYRCH